MMKKFILGLLLIYSVTVVEASSTQQIVSGESGNTYSGVAIGYNPADFTSNYKPFPGLALMDMVVTGLWLASSSKNCSRSYAVVGSEDPRTMKAIEKEIKLSHSIYADPATRLTPNIIVATHLAKGNVIFERDRVTVNIRIEDRQGNVKAEEKVSGPNKMSLYKLIDEAAISLGNQMCRPEPDVKTSCPYLWDVTFKQSGTIDTNRCLGSGLTDGDEISQIDGYAYFPNVLIRPSASYELTWKEDDACESFEKNDIQNNYRAKSQGDTYQKVDGFDGIDADAVYLRVLNIRKGEKKMIFEYGSVPIRIVLSKIASFKRPEDRKSFVLTEGCNQQFTFSPRPAYGN